MEYNSIILDGKYLIYDLIIDIRKLLIKRINMSANITTNDIIHCIENVVCSCPSNEFPESYITSHIFLVSYIDNKLKIEQISVSELDL